MRIYRNFILLASIGAIALMLFSCEAELKLDGLQTQPKLVVNSLFSPDSSWVVHVSKTRNIFNDSKEVQNIEDAKVIITDESTGEEYNLESNGSGYYSLKFLRPIAGRTYSISVSKDGFQTVYAGDETPFPVAVNLLSEEVVEYNGTEVLKVDFEIMDRGDQENYYFWELIITKTVEEENGGSEIKGAALIGSLDMNIDEIPNGEREQNKLFITDLHFDGSSYNTSFYTDNKINSGGDSGDGDPGDGGPVITYQKQLQISVISKDYYLHLRSLEQYENSRNVSSSVAQPTEIYSNIENGLGIFGGFYRMKIDF